MASSTRVTDPELIKRLNSLHEERKPSSFMQGVDYFNKAIEASGLPAAAGGLLHGAASGAANLGNLGIQGVNLIPGVDIEKRASAPEWLDPQKAIAMGALPDSKLNELASKAGELGGELAVGGGAYGALGKLAPLAKETSTAQKAIRSALSGFGTSPEGSRGLGAALGAVLPVIGHYTPLSKGRGSRPIRQSRSQIREADAPPLGMDRDVMDEAAKHLAYPSKEMGIAEQRLWDDAMKGDPDALFNVQSQIDKEARGLTWNPFANPAVRKMGKDMQRFRHKEFLPEFHTALKDAGLENEAELMRYGQDRYRRWAKQRPYRHALTGLGSAYAGVKHNPYELLKEYLTKG